MNTVSRELRHPGRRRQVGRVAARPARQRVAAVAAPAPSKGSEITRRTPPEMFEVELLDLDMPIEPFDVHQHRANAVSEAPKTIVRHRLNYNAPALQVPAAPATMRIAPRLIGNDEQVSLPTDPLAIIKTAIPFFVAFVMLGVWICTH